MEKLKEEVISSEACGYLPEFTIEQYIDKMVIRYNLAGLKKKLVGVTAEDSSLKIRVRDKIVHSFRLIDSSVVEASYEDGMLTIELKSEKPKPKIVKIL